MSCTALSIDTIARNQINRALTTHLTEGGSLEAINIGLVAGRIELGGLADHKNSSRIFWRLRDADGDPDLLLVSGSPVTDLLPSLGGHVGGDTTAANPYWWMAHTACSRDDPVPKLGPATRTEAPA